MATFDLPHLGEPYDAALRDAIEYLWTLPEPVIGIWLAGSVSRGEADANSDLDLYVLIDAAHRRRLSRFFHEVPTEIFLNPPHRARQYFEEERRLGRRPGLDMMAHGLMLFDPLGECATIQVEAREVIELGPAVPAVELETRRYLVIDKLDNAADVLDRDPTAALMLAAQAVQEALVLWFLLQGEWAPRDKDLLAEIRSGVPEAGVLVDRFVAAGDVDAARAAAELLIGVGRFYMWETPPDECPPPE